MLKPMELILITLGTIFIVTITRTLQEKHTNLIFSKTTISSAPIATVTLIPDQKSQRKAVNVYNLMSHSLCSKVRLVG